MEVRAIDTDTGLVATMARRRPGNLTGGDGDEVRTRVGLAVDREGGYRFDIRLYEGGRRVATGSTRSAASRR